MYDCLVRDSRQSERCIAWMGCAVGEVLELMLSLKAAQRLVPEFKFELNLATITCDASWQR